MVEHQRECFVGSPGYFHLNNAAPILAEAFGTVPFLVGSACTVRDWRDVDVRVMLDDAEYDRLFPGLDGNPRTNALWSLLCASVSDWLGRATGLPVDFQVQRATRAGEHYRGKKRIALGIFDDRTATPDAAAPDA
jgi:hypothetical protein